MPQLQKAIEDYFDPAALQYQQAIGEAEESGDTRAVLEIRKEVAGTFLQRAFVEQEIAFINLRESL